MNAQENCVWIQIQTLQRGAHLLKVQVKARSVCLLQKEAESPQQLHALNSTAACAQEPQHGRDEPTKKHLQQTALQKLKVVCTLCRAIAEGYSVGAAKQPLIPVKGCKCCLRKMSVSL